MADATEIKVLSSNAFKEAYVELVREYERASGHKVSTIWNGTADIMKRMDAGETYDLVIMSDTGIETLTKQGKLVAGTRVDLARSGIGVAVRAGARKPDIGTAEALKGALLASNSVGYSTGPSGVYLEALFQRLGIADALKPKIRIAKTGSPVGLLVAQGEVEIGFQQVSELLPVAGIDYVGPLPPEVQHITTFTCGLHAGATQPDAAKALVRFLTAPAAAPVIRRKGLEPA